VVGTGVTVLGALAGYDKQNRRQHRNHHAKTDVKRNGNHDRGGAYKNEQ